MDRKGAQVIDFNDAAEAINSKKLEEIARKTLREVNGRNAKRN